MKLPQSSIEQVLAAFETLDLGDVRRDERVLRIVEKLAANPEASFPRAMGSQAEIEAAYRLMNSEHVTMAQLTFAHAMSTAERALAAGSVIAIHDTTEFAFTHADPEEVGYLGTGQAGFLAHYTLVVPAGTRRALGITHVETIHRDKAPSRPSKGGRAARKKSGTETTRDQDRESMRWLRGIEATQQVLDGCDVIHVADREADNYALFAAAVEQGISFVVRGRAIDRVVNEGDARLLKTVARCAEGMVSRDVTLTARRKKTMPNTTHATRDSRAASLDFRVTRVELRRPRYYDKKLAERVELNVVHVVERNRPAGESAVDWMLFTNMRVDTPDDVARIVDAYRTRWLIEECNKALKTGCKYEEKQFESRDGLLTMLALLLPVACEVLALRALCRENPNRPATDVLSPLQIQILNVIGSRPLKLDATAHDALWAVAALGGHMTCNGEPGWLVLQRGMQDLLAAQRGWVARESVLAAQSTGEDLISR